MKPTQFTLGFSNTKCTSAAGGTSEAIQYYTVKNCESGTMYLEENVLLFVISGVLNITYGAIEEKAISNRLVFLKKKILISYQVKPEAEADTAEYILFSIGDKVIKEFAKLTALSAPVVREEYPVITCNTDVNFSHFISTLQSYFFYPQNIKSNFTRIKLLELLFYIAHHSRSILEQLLHLHENFQPDITLIVEENILNSMSLHQLAVKAGRSLSSFRRDFLSTYNMPPSQWIRQRRLDKAKELLLSTTMSITDICYSTGFENIAHFSRLFKSYFKHCPSEFRQQLFVA